MAAAAVDVCGHLTLISAGGSLIVYNHSTSTSKVIEIFSKNDNNNEGEDDEEEAGGGGGGGEDAMNGKKDAAEDKDGSAGGKESAKENGKDTTAEDKDESAGGKESPKENGKKDKEKKKKKNDNNRDETAHHITAARFSPCGRWVVVGGGPKKLEIWGVEEWARKVTHKLPKRPTAVAVTADSSCVVVADRAGDVYKFDLPTATTTTTTTTSDSSEGPKPILGHLSMLLDVAITPDSRYIVTCDRDEKVRLSHLSHAFLIHTFLLGHLEFVSCLAMLSAHPPRLLSCSGDGTIKLWDYEEGKCLATLDLSSHVSPPPSLDLEEEKEKKEEEEKVGERKDGSTPIPPSTTTIPAIKKIAVISSSSSSASSYLVAALVYRSKEVVLCRVDEDSQLHFISTTELKGEPVAAAWRRRTTDEEAVSGEELILVVEDTSGEGGGVVVMKVVDDKLVEVEEQEEEQKESLVGLGRRFSHFWRAPPNSRGLEFLYKQKYDNVGEYMKKKRERLTMIEEGHTPPKKGRWLK